MKSSKLLCYYSTLRVGRLNLIDLTRSERLNKSDTLMNIHSSHSHALLCVTVI